MSFFDKITQKGFQISLADEYTYPNEKNFHKANAYVMQAALENYCIQNGYELEYLSKENPIRFRLDGKTIYTATLEMGYGRFNQGYHIHCLEEIE